MKLSKEHCRKDIERGRPQYLGKYQYRCHVVHHKSHMNWPEIEPEPL
jgi:hypothetical protein